MRRSRLPVALICFAVLASCGPQADTPAPPASESPRTGGTLRLAEGGDPGSLDPLRMTNNHAARILELMHPGLFLRDTATGEWAPGLATEWTFSADSLAMEVTLDTRLGWSDGQPFGSHDVVASFATYRDEAFGYARQGRFEVLGDVVAVDSSRVRFGFVERVLDPWMVLAIDVLPAHVVATLDPADLGSSPLVRNPVTLGQYRLRDWASNERMVLERNPHHPDPGHVDTIEILILPDGPGRILRLKSGEVDVVGSIPAAQADDLRGTPGVEVVDVPGRSTAFLQYNLRDPLLGDVRIRQAIDSAIDRADICERVYYGYAQPAASFLPPVSWAHDASLSPSAFDPDLASALLTEAGLVDSDGDGQVESDGTPVEFELISVTGDPTREAVAILLQTYLRAVGIGIRIRPIEISSLMSAVGGEDYQILFTHMGGPLDADVRVFLSSEGRFNLGHHEDAEFDRLAQVAAVGPDRATALDAAMQMQGMLQAQQPVTMLYYPSTLVGLSSRVHGATPDYLTPFARIGDWWVDE